MTAPPISKLSRNLLWFKARMISTSSSRSNVHKVFKLCNPSLRSEGFGRLCLNCPASLRLDVSDRLWYWRCRWQVYKRSTFKGEKITFSRAWFYQKKERRKAVEIDLSWVRTFHQMISCERFNMRRYSFLSSVGFPRFLLRKNLRDKRKVQRRAQRSHATRL